MKPCGVRVGAFGLVATLLSGCASIQAIEPVTAPPEQFRFDTLTRVEFVSPTLVGWRCAERGASFMGLPAINSGACADAAYITMTDPCQTLTAGPFANSLCREVRGLVRPKPSLEHVTFRALDEPMTARTALDANALDLMPRDPGLRSIEFVSASVLGEICQEGDGAHRDLLVCTVGDVLLAANPCERFDAGWYERTLCHELGHVNGWSPDHHGGEPRPSLRLASESPEALLAARAAGAGKSR